MSTLAIFNNTLTNERTQNYLRTVLGEKKDSFVANITALVGNNTMLQQCEPMQVLYAAIKATSLDLPLDPNLGYAYVIPYKNTRENKVDAQFQLGYKAFIQLAMRSGQFQTINVRDVREGEVLGEDFVSGEMQFKKLPDEARDKAAIVGYVGFFRLVNGFQKMMYWTVGQLQEHGKKYSKTYSNGQWQQNFDAMARKTVLKLLLSKYAPLSVEMQTAVKYDQSVIVNENGDKVYIDNPQNDNVIKAEVVDSSNPKDDSEAAAAEILKK